MFVYFYLKRLQGFGDGSAEILLFYFRGSMTEGEAFLDGAYNVMERAPVFVY